MKITKRSITGNPVDPAGNARNISITMPTSEWEEVLSPGMAVFDIHIPAGEPLTTGDCGDSMLMAVDFFRDRIIEQSIRAFSCISWLLDIQLAGIMPPDGNIGKFQRELYKFPVDADGDESYRRIFGEDFNKKDLQNAPCGTRMQQAALALLNSGGNLRSGGGFFMIDDLPFGQQRYRGFDRP